MFFACFALTNFCQTITSICFAILATILCLIIKSLYNRDVLTIYLLNFSYLDNKRFQSYR